MILVRRRRAQPAPRHLATLPAVLGVSLCLLASAGCGAKPKAVSSPGSTPPPSPSVPASPSASASPSPSQSAPTPRPSAARATPAASPSHAGASPGPAAPAGPTVAAPRLGTYTYALSGTTQSPVLGLRGPYAPGAALSVTFAAGAATAGGTQEVATSTSQQDGVVTTVTSEWQPSGVRVVSSTLTFLGVASYDCTYSPSPRLLPSPLTVGVLATQTWSSPQCSGSLQVSVLDAETVTAAGQSWNVWRVHTVLHYVAQSSVDVTTDSTSLVSPELGTAVTGDATSSGTVTGSSFSIHQVTTLASHP